MELVKDKTKCCGCFMCYNICPQNAIKIIEDEFGFKYPEIDQTKCIDCGLCKKNCAYQNIDKHFIKPKRAFAAVSNNDNLINKSASGGIFASIATKILNANGIVYGASLEIVDAELEVKHVRVDKKEELIKLQGSKYVQSDMQSIYKNVKEDLENNKIVLFSGTPCQIHSVKSYLNNKEYKNLYCIDIICHGVPNNKMFKDYIKLLENINKGKVINFKFRYKGEKNELVAVAYINKENKVIKKIIPAYTSSFYQLFLDSMIYRDNCYTCPYAQKERIGDITIGDFWKIEKEHPKEIINHDININNGISCILINTKKGERLLEEYGKDINKIESSFDKIAKHNEQLLRPSKFNEEREKILDIYAKENFFGVDKYYKKKNYKKNLARKIFYNLPVKIRKKIR